MEPKDGCAPRDESRLPSGRTATRLPYVAPVLRSLGDVRDVVLGPTAGVAESGGGLVFRV
jgi:hypothetical protein